MTIETDSLIVGGGPCGLFQVFELGLLGIHTHVVEALPHVGGQCKELYPDKPIYDIPAIPVCTAGELVDRLLEQIAPFNADLHLSQQVTQLEARRDGRYLVRTSGDTEFLAKTIVVAGGVGAFAPMPLKLAGIDALVDRSVFYRVLDPDTHAGKKIMILGGGDSALDWTLSLHDRAERVTLVHRRREFREAPASVAEMMALVDGGQMNVMHGNVSAFDAHDDGTLNAVTVRSLDGDSEQVPIDHLLIFFGLSPKLGPIAEWGLSLDRDKVIVDTETFATNLPGVFAIGDISTYPGKRKLILSGFHEAALAAFAIKGYLNPGQKINLQYTTTSSVIHERLGVGGADRKP